MYNKNARKRKTISFHLSTNYTPAGPKQFLHIHVAILGPDVGNFESISVENRRSHES